MAHSPATLDAVAKVAALRLPFVLLRTTPAGRPLEIAYRSRDASEQAVMSRWFPESDGHVAVIDDTAQGGLAELLAAAVSTGDPQLRCVSGSGRSAVWLNAFVVACDALGLGEALVAVVLYERTTCSRPRVDSDQLGALFRLTQAEAAVAAALAAGRSARQIARCHAVAVDTVRTQIKAVLAKTHTHRQAELVALILSSPAWRDQP